jgi:hypothetical protein
MTSTTTAEPIAQDGRSVSTLVATPPVMAQMITVNAAPTDVRLTSTYRPYFGQRIDNVHERTPVDLD